jgi:hypothetical protein
MLLKATDNLKHLETPSTRDAFSPEVYLIITYWLPNSQTNTFPTEETILVQWGHKKQKNNKTGSCKWFFKCSQHKNFVHQFLRVSITLSTPCIL